MAFESEAADKGTAFNEVIDCIIEGRKSTKIDIHSESELITAIINGRIFVFSKELAKNIAKPLKEENAITQYRVEGTISTQYGEVFLYGYLDYLLPLNIWLLILRGCIRRIILICLNWIYHDWWRYASVLLSFWRAIENLLLTRKYLMNKA